MSAPGWTPGPWVVGQNTASRVAIFPDEQVGALQLAVCDKWVAGKNVNNANAALIASAPDLYDALAAFNLAEDMIVGATAHHITVKIPMETIRVASAALARARGEQP